MSKDDREVLTSRLVAEVNDYAKEHNVPVCVALSEVSKREPELWNAYSEAVVGPPAKRREHSAGSESVLMAEARAYAEENHCSLGVALSEVTKRNPELWEQYTRRAMPIL